MARRYFLITLRLAPQCGRITLVSGAGNVYEQHNYV